MNNSDLNIIFGNMSDGVLVVGKKGVVNYINPSARNILGVSKNISTITNLMDLLIQNKINDKFIDLIVNAISEKGETQQALVKYQSDKLESSDSLKHLDVKVSYSKSDEQSVLLTITDVTKREESYSNCRDSGVIIATLLGMLAFYVFTLTCLQMFVDIKKINILFNWICLSSGTVIYFATYKYTSLSLAKSGMRLSNLKNGIKIALIASPIVILFFTVIKFIIMLVLPESFPAGVPLIDWAQFLPRNIEFGDYVYPFSAFIQEFIARIFVHENIVRIFEVYGKKRAGIIAVILSSVLFACVHMHLGFYYFIGAFLLSVILGIFYYKTSNFWAVFLVHMIAGYALIEFLF